MRENWTYKKLGEVCAPKTDILRANKLFRKDDVIEYIDISSIDNCAHRITQPTRFLFYEAPSRAQQKVEQGDILYSLVRPNLKNIAVVTSSNTDKYVASSGFCVLRSKEVDNRYLYYLVLSNPFYDYILGLVSGANYPAVREEDIKGFSFRCPPLSEQQSIVAELDKINELISLKKTQLSDLDALAQSIFYDMFGDPIENEKGWEVKKLGEVCEITSSKRIFAEEYVESGIPFYRSKEVIEKSKGEPISVELFISEDRYKEVKETYGVPAVGDILITAVGTIGKIWLVDSDEPFYFKDGNLVWLRNIKQTESLFFKTSLFYLIDEYKKVNANGAAYNALTIVRLKQMDCPLPPLSLQQSFAKRIELIEQQKAQISSTIKDLETLLASRMQYWFD